MTVGVLALQGDYDAHSHCLQALGVSVELVRQAVQLDNISALVIPGGESSVLLKFLEYDRFWEKLRAFVHHKPCFGTCAGAILLASEVENPQQLCLSAMDISIQRNAYGRQMQSAIHQVGTHLGDDPVEMVFIRAPRITRVGVDVDVLASYQGDPVWLRQGKIMVTTFHPELSKDQRVHAAFLHGIG